MKGKLFKRLTAGALALLMLTTALPPDSDFTGLFGGSDITASAETQSGTCGNNATWEYDTDTKTLTISGTGDMYDYHIREYRPKWFDYKAGIEKIEIAEGITSIGDYAFYQSKITELTIPSTVKRIGNYSFYGCYDLSTLNFASGSKLETIGEYAFSYCEDITSIELPEGLKTIVDYAFFECQGLKSVVIPSTVATIKSHAFLHCNAIDDVFCYVSDPSEFAWAKDEGTNDYSFKPGKATVCHVLTGTKEDYEDRFDLLNLTFKDDLMKCGDNAWCELEPLDPDAEVPYYRLTINGTGDMWDFSSEKYAPWRDVIGRIKEVVITKDITRIGNNAFYSSGQGVDALSMLDTVTFEENSNLKSIGEYSFTQCYNLKSITIPASVKTIESSFANTRLESVTFEENSKLETIGDDAFYCCYYLTSITIPASVKTIESSFGDCGLESITFEKDSKLEKIGENAFNYCMIDEITLPAGLKEIESSAFSNCYLLETVNCLVADPSKLTLGDLSGDFIEYPPKTTICYVPKGTLAAYEAKFASGAETDPNVTFAVKPTTLTIDDDITGGTVTASKTFSPTVEKSFTLDKRDDTCSPDNAKIKQNVYAAKSDTVKISLKVTGNLSNYSISSLGEEDEPADSKPLATGKTVSYTADVTYEDEDTTVLKYKLCSSVSDGFSDRVLLTVIINWTESSDYGVGEQIKLTAAADDGYTFKRFIVQLPDETEIKLDENDCFIMPDNDVFVSAEFTPITYNIDYYNTTGAVNTNPTSYTVESAAITLKDAQKDGYTFKGWYTNAEFTGSPVTQIEKGSTGDKKFYAKWELITYTIEYDLGGGTGNTNPTSYDITTPAITLTPVTRTGYTFVRWDNITGGDRSAITSIPQGSTGDLILEAVWEANSYTVKFDGNGATSGTMDDQAFTYDTAQALTANAFKRTGYTFTGWNTRKDGTGKTYANKASVKNLTSTKGGTVTLYAQWTAIDYTVKFDGNGATSGTMDDQAFTYDTAQALTANAFKRTGYTFTGWNTRKDGSGKTYANKANVKNLTSTKGGTVTLYAQWTAIDYTVKFDGNGATSGTMDDQAFTYDTAQALTANAFKRTGYTFTGWNTRKDGSGKTYANKANVKNLTSTKNGTVTLYAQWTAIDYTVKFDGNGATSGTMDDQAFTYDTTQALTANAFKRTGYTFTGWNTRKDGSGKTYENKANVKNLTSTKGGTVTLYAQWTAIDYTVKFDGNGATSGTMDDQAFTYDTAQTLTANAFKRTGYTFAGWNTKKDGSGKTYANKANVKNLTSTKGGTVTLYAQWKINTYTVTWMNNGKVLKTDTVTYGTIPEYTGETPVLDGGAQYTYEFIGWSEKIVPVTENVTYTAAFRRTTKDYKLTLPKDMTIVGKESDTYLYGETVKFKPEDGKVIIGNVKNGETVIKPEDGVYSVTIKKDTKITAITAEPVAAKKATCTEDGNILYYKGSDGNLYKDTTGTKITLAETVIPATGHKFGTPTWTWTGTTAATAKFTCENDSSHVETVKATITSKTTKATCTADGKTVYTATVKFNGKTYTDTKTVKIDKLGHKFGTPTWTWTGTTAATAKFTCENDSSHVETVKATITSKTTKATCTADGKTVYTATVKFGGKTYTDTKTVVIPATGHKFGAPEWTWTGTTAASAKFTCENDSSHVETVKATITSKTTKATCTADGKTVYTATVKFGGKTYTDTKTVVIPATGHKFGTPTWTWTGTTAASATFTCENDTSHTETVKATITSKTTKATCTADGKTVYTATVKFGGKTYTDTKTVVIPATGHNFGAPSWTWTGTTAASATFTCENDSSHTKMVKATITSKTTKATCTADGKIVYTATVKFGGKTYTDTKAVKIDKLGHKFGEWKTIGFDVSKGTATQKRICSVCAESETRTVEGAIQRFSGDNRYITAAVVSSKTFEKADTVVIAFGENYPDALAAVPLATKLNAPILLSRTSTVPDVTINEIKRLGAKNVIIVGGEGVVSSDAAAQLKKQGVKVERLWGDTRYETTVEIAKKLEKLNGKKPEEVFLVYANNFADALSVNPAAAIKNAPIIYLNDKGTINKTSKAYLESIKGSVKKAYVIGGTGVVSDDMMKQAGDVLGVDPIRIGGQDRYETCTAVHETFKDLFAGDIICIATGADFIDALIGGVFAAVNRSPLFLAAGGLNDAQKAYLKSKAPEKLCVFGGEGAVPDELLEMIAKVCVSG